VVPPAEAVNVTDCEVEIDDAVTLKLAVVAPCATVAVDGTCSALLLLDRLTATALEAAPPREIEHVSLVFPVNDCVPHEILLRPPDVDDADVIG
jgi:hypothetical protein